jgi:peptidoglycan-associated lipoprotein
VAPPAAAPVTNAAPAVQPAPAPTPAPAAAAQPTTQPQVAASVLPAYLDPNNLLSKERSVYFDFDEFTIKSEYEGLIARHGNFLAANPKVAIKIEGNADERGSPEYNLALGQKRAQSVLNALKLMGVKDGQMEAVSWGEERPKNAGHDEAAWAQNRRADLAYPRQ